MLESVKRGLARHFERHASRIEQGAERRGYKVAFNSPVIQQALGLDASLVAGLAGDTLHKQPGPHSLDGAARPLLEPEVAVLLADDIPATADIKQATTAVGAVAAAIELVDLDRPLDQLEEILVEGVFHRAFATGEFLPPPPDCSLRGVGARIKLDGELSAEVDCHEATGDLPALLVYLAGLLDGFGMQLQAGDVILCGSMIAPLEARADSRFEVEFSNGSRVAMQLGE